MKSRQKIKRSLQGIVVSNKMSKTIVVLVERSINHKRYNKIIKRHKKYYAHNENSLIYIGDRVQIIASSPISKTKRWRFQKVINRILR